MPLKKNTIGLLDLNPTSAYLLERNLKEAFEVLKFPTIEQLKDYNGEKLSAVVADFDTLLKEEELFLNERTSLSTANWAIATDRKLMAFLPYLCKWKIFNVIPKNTPIGQEQVVSVENLIEPLTSFGLVRYFKKTFQMFTEEVYNRDAKTRVVEKVINHFATCGYEVHQLYDVRLVMEEMINNALFHAFRDDYGIEKYNSSNFTTLAENENITVEYGSDNTFVGFSITDNQGNLRPEVVVDKISRQVFQQGLFDESGRGIYLSRLLSSQLICNIHRGYRTQVIVMFYERTANTLKPLCVNFSESPPPVISSLHETPLF